jgi:predicted Rossmann fold nucleotide-binding protein DprA/Smf involved in DNA uptake
VTRPDDAYPSRLKELLGQQAPSLLFGAGQQAALRTPGIAVVGSRDVDEGGLEFATALGRLCAKQGYVAVSGAARGVDLAAMSGSIASGGIAIGVTVDPLERLVSRGALRTAIADEQLTLVTPYHPAARWHAGNAMRRNRLIYALAQAAVVVASSAEKGGTRSGALEDLKAGWVPLHVRDDGSAGNRRLISEGGIALPMEELDGLELEKLTRDRQDSLLTIGDRPPGDDADGASASDSDETGPDQANAVAQDAFVAIWPILAPYLRVPLGERDVAERLRLEPTQARAWLKRAVEEGYAEVKPRPKRYVLREAAAEQLRIDGA